MSSLIEKMSEAFQEPGYFRVTFKIGHSLVSSGTILPFEVPGITKSTETSE